MSPVATTADMILTDYQRGQLAHMRSLLEMSKKDNENDATEVLPDPAAAATTITKQKVGFEDEDVAYKRSKAILDSYLQRLSTDDHPQQQQQQQQQEKQALPLSAGTQQILPASKAPPSPSQNPDGNKVAKRKSSEADDSGCEKDETKKKRKKQHAGDSASTTNVYVESSSVLKQADDDIRRDGNSKDYDSSYAEEAVKEQERNIVEATAMMRDAHQSLESAKKELQSKQKQFDALTAQLAEYTNKDDPASAANNDENLVALQKKVETFQLSLDEARSKKLEAEKKNRDIQLKALAAKKAKDKWMTRLNH